MKNVKVDLRNIDGKSVRIVVKENDNTQNYRLVLTPSGKPKLYTEYYYETDIEPSNISDITVGADIDFYSRVTLPEDEGTKKSTSRAVRTSLKPSPSISDLSSDDAINAAIRREIIISWKKNPEQTPEMVRAETGRIAQEILGSGSRVSNIQRIAGIRAAISRGVYNEEWNQIHEE